MINTKEQISQMVRNSKKKNVRRRVKSTEKSGYLYLMIDENERKLEVKVGRSGNLEKRPDGLYYGGSGVSTPLKIIAKVFVEDMENRERAIHTIFSHLRINPIREFFAPRIVILNDFDNVSFGDLRKMLYDEVISPIKNIFDTLRSSINQPENDANYDLLDSDVSENENENEIQTNTCSTEQTISKNKNAHFISVGLDYYNNSKMALTNAIINNTLPSHIQILNPRKNRSNKKTTVLSWIYRNYK